MTTIQLPKKELLERFRSFCFKMSESLSEGEQTVEKVALKENFLQLIVSFDENYLTYRERQNVMQVFEVHYNSTLDFFLQSKAHLCADPFLLLKVELQELSYETNKEYPHLSSFGLSNTFLIYGITLPDTLSDEEARIIALDLNMFPFLSGEPRFLCHILDEGKGDDDLFWFELFLGAKMSGKGKWSQETLASVRKKGLDVSKATHHLLLY